MNRSEGTHVSLSGNNAANAQTDFSLGLWRDIHEPMRVHSGFRRVIGALAVGLSVMSATSGSPVPSRTTTNLKDLREQACARLLSPNELTSLTEQSLVARHTAMVPPYADTRAHSDAMFRAAQELAQANGLTLVDSMPYIEKMQNADTLDEVFAVANDYLARTLGKRITYRVPDDLQGVMKTEYPQINEYVQHLRVVFLSMRYLPVEARSLEDGGDLIMPGAFVDPSTNEVDDRAIGESFVGTKLEAFTTQHWDADSGYDDPRPIVMSHELAHGWEEEHLDILGRSVVSRFRTCVTLDNLTSITPYAGVHLYDDKFANSAPTRRKIFEAGMVASEYGGTNKYEDWATMLENVLAGVPIKLDPNKAWTKKLAVAMALVDQQVPGLAQYLVDLNAIVNKNKASVFKYQTQCWFPSKFAPAISADVLKKVRPQERTLRLSSGDTVRITLTSPDYEEGICKNTANAVSYIIVRVTRPGTRVQFEYAQVPAPHSNGIRDGDNKRVAAYSGAGFKFNEERNLWGSDLRATEPTELTASLTFTDRASGKLIDSFTLRLPLAQQGNAPMAVTKDLPLSGYGSVNLLERLALSPP